MSSSGPEAPTNLKFDENKIRYSLVPPLGIQQIASIMTFGAEKYLPHSWQNVENGQERYLDGLMRHVEAFRLGEDLDDDTKMHHLAHAGCCLFFIMHFLREQGRLPDFTDAAVQARFSEISDQYKEQREEALRA